MLRVGEIVEEAGTSFAFPSRTLYLGKDGGLDTERGDAAMEQVRSWRDADQLPFPNMTDSRRQQLADTLDYPPRGSPDALDSKPPESDASESLSKEEEGSEPPSELDSPKLP